MRRRRQRAASDTAPSSTAISAAHGTAPNFRSGLWAANMFHFRSADCINPGFEQDSVQYTDSWEADQRQHRGGWAGAIMTSVRHH